MIQGSSGWGCSLQRNGFWDNCCHGKFSKQDKNSNYSKLKSRFCSEKELIRIHECSRSLTLGLERSGPKDIYAQFLIWFKMFRNSAFPPNFKSTDLQAYQNRNFLSSCHLLNANCYCPIHSRALHAWLYFPSSFWPLLSQSIGSNGSTRLLFKRLANWAHLIHRRPSYQPPEMNELVRNPWTLRKNMLKIACKLAWSRGNASDSHMLRRILYTFLFIPRQHGSVSPCQWPVCWTMSNWQKSSEIYRHPCQ